MIRCRITIFYGQLQTFNLERTWEFSRWFHLMDSVTLTHPISTHADHRQHQTGKLPCVQLSQRRGEKKRLGCTARINSFLHLIISFPPDILLPVVQSVRPIEHLTIYSSNLPSRRKRPLFPGKPLSLLKGTISPYPNAHHSSRRQRGPVQELVQVDCVKKWGYRAIKLLTKFRQLDRKRSARID